MVSLHPGREVPINELVAASPNHRRKEVNVGPHAHRMHERNHRHSTTACQPPLPPSAATTTTRTRKRTCTHSREPTD